MHFRKIVSDKLSKLDSKLSDIWNYFRTMSDGRRQTESLLLTELSLLLTELSVANLATCPDTLSITVKASSDSKAACMCICVLYICGTLSWHHTFQHLPKAEIFIQEWSAILSYSPLYRKLVVYLCGLTESKL